MAEIELVNVSKSYGPHRVLHDVNAAFARNRFSVVLGPPISGKSVLMRLIMGLEPVGAGTVLLRGKDVTKEQAGTRCIGYVPQSFALYPHFRVVDNIAYPLTLAGRNRSEVRPQVEALARKLRLTDLLEKYPNQLSGGEKQRVALARGMIKETSVFILDDPLVGLDFKLREQLFVDLREMLSEVDGTFIYTTSDPLETLALADHVFILDEGTLHEQGELNELYYHPHRVRTLQLLGFPAANLVPGELRGGRCRTALGEFSVPGFAGDSRRVIVGFRPESISFSVSAVNQSLHGTGRATLREDLGAETLIYFEMNGVRLVGAWPNGQAAPVESETVPFSVSVEDLLCFDADTGDNLFPATSFTAASAEPTFPRG
jgi:ABC-type sugar transport system ATPase subunit